ncbi:hypothetical protein Ccrd_017942 [Cynara cardunculus var. scolymus]|uniref:Protein yippee-like n=1 Tax=Cynara cardunculus var. scolymus TaxID=59895 RepID=A0A103Y766_CYNCS|nr:hypothetical protein Ccrd_017942 [Cynara cardunculus var. scolymus]
MSQADISYSCGSCGYQLNLSSANKSSGTTSEYRESIKKGSISFQSIDPSRFTQIDEVSCIPITLGRNALKTKLMCRQCGVLIGYGYREGNAQCVFDSRISSDPSYKKVVVKIQALQPSDIVS